MNTLSPPRLWSLDLIRGLSIVGMIVFHVFFMMDFFHIVENNMHVGTLHVLARAVQFSFLGLVGVSLSISAKKYSAQFFRGLFVFACGMLVTLVTYFLMPQEFVVFGILHLIGVSIILFAPLAHKKFSALILGIIAFTLGIFLNTIQTSVLWLAVFGFQTGQKILSIDFFPFFPWISTVLFGIFFGNLLKPVLFSFHKKYPSLPSLFAPILLLGRYSLFVYLVHIPLIFMFLFVLNLVPFSSL